MAQAHAAQGGRDRLKLRALALAAAAAQACVSAPPEVRPPDGLGAIAVVAGTKQPEVSWRDPRYEAEGAPPRAEATMPGAPDVKAIQATLREQVIAAFSARGSRPVEPPHADALAEVSLSRVGLDSLLQFYMHATVRLVRRVDGTELSATEYVHTGARQTYAAWSENGGARLHGALKAGYEALGAHIHDSVLLLYPLADREWRPSEFFLTAYGLAPIEPALVTPRLTLVRVAGAQPTLRWQAFPRAEDVAAAPEAMARVRNVRYDLVIAREHELAPAEIVYRREALPQPAHTLEAPLPRGRNYYWTVRARFELDGRERVTSWGSTRYAARDTWTAPSRYSYRFRIP